MSESKRFKGVLHRRNGDKGQLQYIRTSREKVMKIVLTNSGRCNSRIIKSRKQIITTNNSENEQK